MPRIESGVLKIRSVITRYRSVSQNIRCECRQCNHAHEQFALEPTRVLNVNARSLSIEKLYELLEVARMNDVACVNFTETWFKSYMASESDLQVSVVKCSTSSMKPCNGQLYFWTTGKHLV